MADTSKRRKVINGEGRQIVANVYHFLKEEYKFTELHREPNFDISHMRNITKRTALATGVCERTVQKILKEEREMSSIKREDGSTSPQFISPMKNRRKRKNQVDIDERTADMIRSTIQNFQFEQEQNLTLAKLKSVLNEKIGFNGCQATLRKILNKLGYKWCKAGNWVLVEQHDIILHDNLQDDSKDVTIKQEETSTEEESSYDSD